MIKEKNKEDFVKKNEEKTKELEAKYLRALADYQNLIKQTAREKSEFAKYANEGLLMDLLPVYDHLKMSLVHADEKNNNWLSGLEHVIKQFAKVLNDNGVIQIETVGQKFDHNLMEAVESEETTDEDKEGLVAKEIKAGYVLNGKVIVPARVAVFKLKS